MDERQYIIYGYGYWGRKAIEEYGLNNIRYIIDRQYPEDDINGIPCISIEQYCEKRRESDVVIVAVSNIEALFDITETLKHYDIKYKLYGLPNATVYVHGIYPNIHYETNLEDLSIKGNLLCDTFVNRLKRWMTFFEGAVKKYKKNIDIFLYTQDSVADAEKVRKILNIPYIFAFSTIYVYENSVIPVPDYMFGNIVEDDKYGLLNFEDEITLLRKNSEKKYKYNKAFWVGNAKTSVSRNWLIELGKRFPENLDCRDFTWESMTKYIPRTEIWQWKYLIDIRGYGWTDRVKMLMHTGRPLLLVDRPYKEFYFDDMKPMVHYVPIKEDLSDLIYWIEYLESHEDVYENIVRNSLEFAENRLTLKSANKYILEILEKYNLCK